MDAKKKIKFVYAPIIILIIAIVGFGFWFGCRLFSCNINKLAILSKILSFAPKILLIVLLFFVFKILYLVVVDLFLVRFLKKIGSNRLNAVVKIVNLVWWTIFIFVILSTLVGNISAFITSFGLIGLGLSFALQKPISNIVGWITIVFKGIYEEGDRVQIGNARGDVKDIQLMNTVIDSVLESSDDKDKKTITFPNDTVLNTEVINFSKNENYIKEEVKVSITYESNYHKAMEIMRNIIVQHIKENKSSYKVFSNNSKIKTLIGINKTDKNTKKFEEEFEPNIMIDLNDSSIDITGQYMAPYDETKESSTVIRLRFLDAVKKERTIQFAYPHVQLVEPGINFRR